MQIGTLAARTGLAASRIRFYEAQGLLRVGTRKANGYRDYPESAVALLRLITDAQGAGFSLAEIAALLPTGAGDCRRDALVAALRTKIAEIAAMQQRLGETRARLETMAAELEGDGEFAERLHQSVVIGAPVPV